LAAVPRVVIAEGGGLEVEQIRSLSHISLRIAPFQRSTRTVYAGMPRAACRYAACRVPVCRVPRPFLPLRGDRARLPPEYRVR
jgi:hypothetical protein